MVELKRSLKDDGVWIPYGKDAKFKIVDPSSRKAKMQAAELFTVREMNLMQEGQDAILEYYQDLPAIEFSRKDAKLAAFFVVDWEGFTSEGQPLPFDMDELIDWLSVEPDAKLLLLTEMEKLRNPDVKSKTKKTKKKPKK